jgi:hypothetical protein
MTAFDALQPAKAPAIDPEIIAFALGLAPQDVPDLIQSGEIGTAIAPHRDPALQWRVTFSYNERLLHLATDPAGILRELSVEPMPGRADQVQSSAPVFHS